MGAVSRRKVEIVLLCEGEADDMFVRRVLMKRGWDKEKIRVQRLPKPERAGEQFVRERFPVELRAMRARHVGQALIVMIDGDKVGVEQRNRQLADACRAANVEPVTPDDPVAILVPSRHIETWFAYLDGHEVNEGRDYKQQSRHPGKQVCNGYVEELLRMCDRGRLRGPAPPSLVAACEEFTGLMTKLGRRTR
jgi:hypothetical protein